MVLAGGVMSVTGISFLMFCLFIVAFLGSALGRISVKGVSLGTAGVFIVALLFGCFFFEPLKAQLKLGEASYIGNALKIIENFGLMLFVASVGFIAGPNFFAGLKKNFKSYITLGAVIILAGALTCVACVLIGCDAPMAVGILSGALTSTPAFSAAKAPVAEQYEGLVSVGHGIAYIFGVIGVVLFVQLVPKLTKANMEEERAKLVVNEEEIPKKTIVDKLFEIDHMGVAAFSLAAILGVLIGAVKIPLTGAGYASLFSGNGVTGTCFSLTTTGGCLLVSLILGHFGRIGKINIMPSTSTLKLFRELGLVLFLVGAGIPGGAEFVANFDIMYFVYGIIMTVVPLFIGFLFAKYVLKLSLLNNLGSITGGMTSTPALGTLIKTAGTEDVAAAYASTYPVALIAVVLVSQFLVILF